MVLVIRIFPVTFTFFNFKVNDFKIYKLSVDASNFPKVCTTFNERCWI